MRVKSNRENPLAGNIARVLAGKVPAHRAPYGYRYCRAAEIDQRGRVRLLKAWWEVDQPGPDGQPLWGNPAWTVIQVFEWIGNDERTVYWVVNKLNDTGIKCLEGGNWSPGKIAKIIRRRSYTGRARYNEKGRVADPDRPLGDLTLGIPRTIVRPKPDDGRPENQKVPVRGPEIEESKLPAESGENRRREGV